MPASMSLTTGRRRPPVLAGLLAAAVGCGPPPTTVEGTVRFQGRPVSGGTIYFLAPEGGRRAAWAPIQDGRYQITRNQPAEPGVYRVEIRQPRPSGRRRPALLPATQERQGVEAASPPAAQP
ncbi:MAG: hypothetical protein ACKONH_09985, partial [Planctomycetia bacterium]